MPVGYCTYVVAVTACLVVVVVVVLLLLLLEVVVARTRSPLEPVPKSAKFGP